MKSFLGEDVCNIVIDIDKVYVTYNSVAPGTDEVIKKTKFMSLDNLVSSIKSMDTSMATPILPNYCFSYSKSGNTHKYLLFSPACKTEISYRVSSGSDGVARYKNAFFPSFIITTTFNGGMGYCNVYMVDSNITSVCDLRNNTVLYKMPFPNVYNDNRICWGYNFGSDNAMNNRNCGLLVDIFKASTFNFDLFDDTFGKICRATGKSTMEEYFTLLTTLEEWPEDLKFKLDLQLGGII